MAKGRMLNRKVAISQPVAAYGEEMGGWAVVFHHRLIAFLDVYGNCRADPYWLKGEIMPCVGEVLPETCRTYVHALARHGLAILYEARGMQYLHMPGFKGEQGGLRADKERPECPLPPGFNESDRVWPEEKRPTEGRYPAHLRAVAGP